MFPGTNRSSPVQVFSHLRHRFLTMPAEYRRKWSMSIEDWLILYYERVLAKGSHWMGVRALKNPLDIWVYQEILHETKPNLMLELGSAYGGSALFFAHMFDLLGNDGMVVTIDHSHDEFRARHERIRTITGDTRRPEVIDQARSLCEGRRVMMVHDASHDAPVVLEDLRNYSPLVSAGCYMVVEDGGGELISPVKGGRTSPGPYTAIGQFLAENDAFELDPERERHIATYAPHGFLRRVR
jgi:cephalosporin hydroxylase